MPVNVSASYTSADPPQRVPLLQLQQRFQQHNQASGRGTALKIPWALSKAEKQQYDQIFRAWDQHGTGFIHRQTALEVFGQSGLDRNDLVKIWTLADADDRGKLNPAKFYIAMGLIYRRLNGNDIPDQLPPELVPPSSRDLATSVSFFKDILKTEQEGRRDMTVYKHQNVEAPDGFYQPRNRHVDRSQADDASPASDLSRQLLNTQKMLDDTLANERSSDALDREMQALRYRIVTRLQEYLEDVSKGPRTTAKEEARRYLERALVTLMHEVPELENKVEERAREREARREREKRELARDRDRDDDNGRYSPAPSRYREEEDRLYSTRSAFRYDRDDRDYDRNARDRGPSSAPPPPPPAPTAPTNTASQPPPPPPPAAPSQAPSRSPAPALKRIPEERQAYIRAEAHRRLEARKQALGVSSAASSSAVSPTLETTIEDCLAQEKKEAEEKANETERQAAEREKQRKEKPVGLLENELGQVTQITERDPSNYKGYERKHAILHNLGRYKEAFDAFETMLSRIENSLDPQIRDMRGCYLDITLLIREAVQETIQDIPRVLINTTTGRLYDKAMQAAAFEESSMFNELRSFMTTRDRLDHARIQREVEKFYEYVMFSHRWQPPEPSFQMVENTSIYELPTSPTVDKLINFYHLVQSRRFRWAWSDTCCVNHSDKGVQQESVVAMFQWYCRAALTVVHLLGVHSKSQKKGSLWNSIWNTRGWTYQEYVASKVVQFYTEDWKPYFGLKIFNHKESPIILAEMEQATKFATRALATLQPGLTRVREKLYLASKRQTTRKEDTAYCLFGIFDVALPVIYGEGMRAVGRLLEHILTRSANVTILAWTGISGSNHSYLPLDLTVYDQVIPLHVPQPIETAKIDSVTEDLQSSLPDASLSSRLYKQLCDLPSLSLVSGRLRLSGLVFPLNKLERLPEHDSDTLLPVYRAISPALGDVLIETKDNLVRMEGLVLVHPWISPLIDEDFSGSTPRFDPTTRALRLIVRLRQPFGALLLASQSRVQYTRVATDSFIKVQIREETPLEELMDSIGTVDVQ